MRRVSPLPSEWKTTVSSVRFRNSGTPVVYAPPMRGLVMAVIRLLPRAVMRRVGF